MPERMLFADTVAAIKSRSQTVTWRAGGTHLQRGDRVEAVNKAWMLSCPVAISPLARLEIVSVREVRLRRLLQNGPYAVREMEACGFPKGSVRAYVASIISRHKDLTLDAPMTRFEFRYVS